MRSKMMIVLLIIVAMALTVGCTRIGPGHAGIKVALAGTERGVQDLPIRTGWVFYWPLSSQVIEYPTFVQTAIWTSSKDEGSPANESITFNAKDGMVLTANISLSYQIEPKKIPSFYNKFLAEDIDVFTHGYLRNVARDSFNEIASSKYTAEEVYSSKKEEFLTEVRARIQKEMDPVGFQLVQLGFVDAPVLPPNILAAINEKLAAIQNAIKAENELRQTQAEAAKRVAAAEGEAKSNQILTSSLSPTLMEWRRLEITEKAVAKWNGARPMVEGTSGGLLLQLQAPTK